MVEQNGRIPPSAVDVERTVLGAMLTDPLCLDGAMGLLNDACFYLSKNRIIFECIKTMFEKNIPIDVISLKENLIKAERFEAVGEEGYIAEIMESICTEGNIEYYCNILLDKSTLRKLILSSAETQSLCFDPSSEAGEVLNKTEATVFEISEKRVKDGFHSVASELPKFFERVESFSNGKKSGIQTGFTDLDDLISGFDPGDLIIIAGRPSMGKTAFCISMGLNIAIKNKHSIGIFSLEMSRSQLIDRMVCSEARISIHQMRSGTLTKRDLPKLSFASGPLYESGIFIDDTPAITTLELRSKARRLKRKEGIEFILIDYLQLMASIGKHENRQQEITTITRTLKAIAKELGVPIAALSQLSRAVETRPDHRPQLSDLRESGAIEQDADIVLFVYRDEVYNKDRDDNKGKAEIIIGKQRNGPIGTANLMFSKEYARFENLSKEYHGEPGAFQNSSGF
jgi:replicative DNA helicase